MLKVKLEEASILIETSGVSSEVLRNIKKGL